MRYSTLAVTLSALNAVVLGAPGISDNLNVLEKRFWADKITWYNPGLGSCGKNHKSSDYVVALNAAQWNNGAHCFKKVVIHANGKSNTAAIVEMCSTCDYGDLALSPVVFQYFAPLSQYIISGSWNYS